ncbi:MAG: HAMP domain-containing sensor histidine kinase [Cyanobacteria bacterium P01_A01_bin.37]
MFQTTRRRLALWYAGITAMLLILFASVVYAYVRTTLVERVDDTLNHVVEVVQRSLVVEPSSASPGGSNNALFQVNIEDSFRNNAETGDDDHIDLEWFNNQGILVWSTLAQPLQVPLHVNPYGETVRLNSDQFLRQVTKRVQVGRDVLGYLRVSHPWFEVTAPSQKLMVDLATGIVVIVATVAGLGWFLSGLAMEPVQDSYQKLKQFTADASHELRNPIAVIQTNVQVALADPEPDVQFQQDQLQVIERITRRLGKMVDDLLFLARQDSGIIQLESNPVSLGGLLFEVVTDQAAIAAETGIQLTFDCPETPHINALAHDTGSTEVTQHPSHDTINLSSPQPSKGNVSQASPLYFVQGDRDQLTRLFTNLISNAIQYTPPSGTVAIALNQSIHPSDGPTRRKERTKDWAVIQVTDSGIGIAESEIPHIFDRFYRVDRARSAPRTSGSTQATHPKSTGSGLGLSIAKTIVDNHGGHISVTSSIHAGTTFTIKLPLVRPPVLDNTSG